ncbi:copper resistance D family protein [Halalkalibacter alkaliphilus]|uniref:CopD family protein n=1 Tax=Halalkalibacter alkaliphilus TaxID=2917993 RepID=A0A9X2CSD8_9BACI|nr:CopD family protein [Halalkalibacter alkaliphilus]MCL7747390.1 CopD family protein [Halalkalibacter alkaliphilus]
MIDSIANVLLYTCFSLLMGFLFLYALPNQYRPNLLEPKNLMKGIIILIPVLLLVPVIRVVLTLYKQFSVPLFEAIGTVVLEYSTGQAFVLSSIISIILIAYYTNLKGSWIAVLLVLLLIVLASWSSHGAAVAGMFGFIGNTLHLVAVSIWIGTLAVVGWFAYDWKDPRLFTRWFSAVAFAAVAIIIASGFMLMAAIVPEYVQSWLLTYGQLLLIKHLLFLPLLVFGLHHFLLGMRNAVDKVKVTKSFRIESMIALLVFGVSAFMTEQTPPHEVAQTLQTESVSPLMQLFLTGPISIGAITLSVSILSISLFVLGFFVFIYATWILIKSLHVNKSVFAFAVSIVLLYLTLMFSVEIGGYEQDETVYSSIKEAVSQTYQPGANIEVLVTEQHEEEIYIVYTVNQHDLVAEKVIHVDGGYKRLPAAMLTIGGTAVVDEKQKIRTFRVQSGNWHDDRYAHTYVTFGMIQDPIDVARVQIHYEGGSYIAQLEQQTFLNVVSSNENWADQHPIDFLAENGQVIETYSRNVMEEGVYCH